MKTNIPTTIFSGFLGSGKTTIISHLIDVLQKKGEQVIYIKNEIGDEDVDTKIMQGKGIKTRELLNGCICCTLVGPFISSINEVVESFNPDRILIEASGAADPSALALMVSSHPLLERDGVIGIVDVVNFTGYKDLSVTAQNQTKFTDLIIFNKVELADLNKKRAVVGYVRELNTHSPIVEAPQGTVHPDIVFGLNSKELDLLLSEEHETHSNHIHEDEIQSFTISSNTPVDQSEFEDFLASLPENIFRAKGFILLKNSEPQLNIFNTVGKRTTFLPQTAAINRDAGNTETDTKNLLIFIGYHAHEYEAQIKAAFATL